MEKIEQVLDLPKFNAAIVAHNKKNPSFLSILLSEEGPDEDNPGFGWYLYLEHLGNDKRMSPAYIDLDPDEVQFLQTTLTKALYKLTILEKVKVSGFYSLNYDGIKNLKLEIKSQDGNAWLELALFSKSQKKFVTIHIAEDVRALLQKLQTVKPTGESMVKQLETIDALTENLVKQSTITPVAPAAPALTAAPAPATAVTASATPTATSVAATPQRLVQPIDGTRLVKQLENMAHKTKKIY